MAAETGVRRVVGWVLRLKPVRVAGHYQRRSGPLMSAGMSFQAIFALFAALWVAFCVFGFILAGNRELSDELFRRLNAFIPNLVGPDGLIHEDALTSARILGWTGAIAVAGLFWTALSWLGTLRTAIGRIFDLPDPVAPFWLLLLRDLAAAIGAGVGLVVASALSLVGNRIVGWLSDAAGVSANPLYDIGSKVVSTAIMLVIHALLLYGALRWVGALRIPRRALLEGLAVGAVALTVLQLLASFLIGRAASNPLLATFAAFVGLMVWLNFMSQAVLIATAWSAVTAADRDERVERLGEPEPGSENGADTGTSDPEGSARRQERKPLSPRARRAARREALRAEGRAKGLAARARHEARQEARRRRRERAAEGR